MTHDDWIARCTALLNERQERSLFRAPSIVHAIDSTHIRVDGTDYVNFASNNYLGLTHHPKIIAAANATAADAGNGSGAAGLITGHSDIHAACEAALATWKGTQAALLFPSGYQANLAVIQTLEAIGKAYPAGVRFILDKLVHASLVDATRATGLEMRIFPHNHLSKLERLLSESKPEQLQVVLTESVFSMDGDFADLRGIAALKQKYSFVLCVDEAHGSGVYGVGGAGLISEWNLQAMVDVSTVTISKALGGQGGAVCSSSVFHQAMINFGRAYLFSTSISPGTAAAAQAAIDVMRDEPQRQKRLRELAQRVRKQLADSNLIGGPADSPILIVLLGEAERALKWASELKRAGMWVGAVRPPTVGPGSSRLRITVSSDHTDAEVSALIAALEELSRKMK